MQLCAMHSQQMGSVVPESPIAASGMLSVEGGAPSGPQGGGGGGGGHPGSGPHDQTPAWHTQDGMQGPHSEPGHMRPSAAHGVPVYGAIGGHAGAGDASATHVLHAHSPL
jgi:hypothetical protein